MADNVQVNLATSTGATIATDDIGGVHYQIHKLGYGPLDSITIVASTTPLPVTQTTAITVANPTTAVSVAGTVSVGNPTTSVSIAGTVAVSSGTVTVGNPTTAVSVAASSLAALWVLSTGVTVTNPSTIVTVANPTTLVTITNPSTIVTVANPTTTVTVGNPTTNISLGSTLTDVAVVPRSDRIVVGSVPYTPQYARIAASTAGNTTIVAGATNARIRVLSMFVVATTAVNLLLIDGATSALFGSTTIPVALTANSGFVLPFSPAGHFETASTQPLIANLSASVNVAGSLVYIAAT